MRPRFRASRLLRALTGALTLGLVLLVAPASAQNSARADLSPAASASTATPSAATASGASTSPNTTAPKADTVAGAPVAWPTTPTFKPDGSRWRIGYMQGGDYADYPVILHAMLQGLGELGWLDASTLPATAPATARELWLELNATLRSDYLEFVPDAFYASGNFDERLRPAIRRLLLERLEQYNDLDMMLALGTWAGQDLAKDDINIPVIVASTSDPIRSGIVTSATDSGHDHVHAKVEPERYERQLHLFHDIVPFKRLGVVYENSPEGRTFSGMNAIEQVRNELGFELITCEAPFSGVATAEASAAAEACYAEIAPKVDAVYVTVHRGVNQQSLPRIARTLIQNAVPSFSMLGSDEVKRGVLLSMAQDDYSHVGLFHAETMARIFHGASPRALNQIWISPAAIAINLATAERIGFDPPLDILLASDEVYDSLPETPAALQP